jgi:biotin-(acetyl-CoA carboxylase) ligase
MLNKRISVTSCGTPLSGVVKGVTQDGGLILHAGGREQVLFAGDVSILEGYA